MTFLELAVAVLKESDTALTVSEIWVVAIAKGYDKLLNSKGETPERTLGSQLYVSTRDNPKSLFQRIEGRPKKFTLKTTTSQQLIDPEKLKQLKKRAIELRKLLTEVDKDHYKESDLHAFLTYYAFLHMRCYTKTLRHHSSSKKEYGEWVHPDIIGCCYSFEDWAPEVNDLSSSIGNTAIKLISFELKRELDFNNLRASFFQTVSNSSWANESYLVAAKISEDPEFMDELTRLSSSFGIGIIKLNVRNPDSSSTIIPAKFRATLDWETINKLTMNKDFKEFLSRVKIDINSKKIHKQEYDKVLETEELKMLIDKIDNSTEVAFI